MEQPYLSPTTKAYEYLINLNLPPHPRPGYHTVCIPKGEVGEVTKVVEESLEMLDAVANGNVVMALQEASDLVGAIKAWLDTTGTGITLVDLEIMHNTTKRAFDVGQR